MTKKGLALLAALAAMLSVAGGAMVVMDIPPFCTAQGDRAELVGVNSIGLARHGFSDEQIEKILRGNWRRVLRQLL